MSNHANTKTHTLPATGTEVPAALAAYSIKAYKSMLTATGLVDTANLYQGSTLVGAIRGDDNGGPTTLWAESMDEHALFVDACGDQPEEATLDALMVEALMAQQMNKVLRKGKLIVVLPGKPVSEWLTLNLPMSKASLTEFKTMLAKAEFQQGLAAKFGAGSRFWNSQTWVTV